MDSHAPIQLVIYAWGQAYVQELLDITLPAVLAPGNLPALVVNFDCRFTLFTEAKFFKEIGESATFAAIQKQCPADLYTIDDLVANRIGYGHSLTHILYRALHSAKQPPYETTFLFLNADWILGAHCFEALIEPLKRGERLIVAPSYCAISELIKPILLATKDRDTQILALEHRDLADLIIRYRHDTIRAKTLTQTELHAEAFDQFYWTVDQHTILGRQMPIAVVCMRPEIVADQPRTFWDYGVVSEMCPSIRPVVMTDSDDFLMMELRSAATYKQNIRFGPPDRDEIISVLSRFTTKDHRDFGRYTLVLHSHGLPDVLAAEQHKFEAYVDDILQSLGPPVEHIGHEYWWALETSFEMIRDAYCASSRAAGGSQFPIPTMEEAFAVALASFHQDFANTRTTFYGRLPPKDCDSITTMRAEWVDERARLTKQVMGFRHVLSVLKSFSAAKIALFESEIDDVASLMNDIDRDLKAETADPAQGGLSGNRAPNSLYGWYFDLRVLQPLVSSLDELPDRAVVLIIVSNQSSPVPRVLTRSSCRYVVAPLSALQMDDMSVFSAGAPYDAIVCHPEIADLRAVGSITPKLRQNIVPGGSIYLCVIDFNGRLQKVASPQTVLPDCCETKLTIVTGPTLVEERWWRLARRLKRFPLGLLIERAIFKIVRHRRKFAYKSASTITQDCVAIILRAVPLQ